MRALLRVALLWLAAESAAHAADIRAVAMPDGNGQAIVLSGVIVPGDEIVFHALAEATGKAMVVTTGPGGSVGAATAIGSEIRRRGWSTLVPRDTRCASACSMIWLAGQIRLLAAGAQIGFHAMSQVRDGARREDHSEDFYLRQWLTGLGYAMDATATIVNTPADFVHWYDAIELNANGIPTALYP